MKIYDRQFPGQKARIRLKTAKIESIKDEEFVMTVEIKKKIVFFGFKSINLILS
jgi:hypothetical protein